MRPALSPSSDASGESKTIAGPAKLERPVVGHRQLDDPAVRAEAAADDDDRRPPPEGALRRPDGLLVGHGDPVEVGRDGVAGDGQRVAVEQRLELLHDRPGAARVLELLDRRLAVGPDRGEQRHPVGQRLEQPVDVRVGLRLGRDRLQVLDRVDRPADREDRGDRVRERGRGHDVPRPQVLGDHLDDAGGGVVDRPPHRLAVRPHRGGSRQRHAQRLARQVHRVGGADARAHARAEHGVGAHLGQLGRVQPAAGDVAGRQEHVLDVAVPAPVGPARLVAAGDHDRRDVQPGGRHQLAGRGLVAGRQADHPVQLGALDLHLDVVGDEVAGGQDVPAAVPGAVNEVARGGGADLEADPARQLDRPLGPAGDLVEVAEADRELRGRVDDGDLRLDHVLVGQAEREPLRPPGRPPGGARLVVGAQLRWPAPGHVGTSAPDDSSVIAWLPPLSSYREAASRRWR